MLIAGCRHYMEVRGSFVHYIDTEMPAYARAVEHLKKLPPDMAARLPPSTAERLERMKLAIEANQRFLDEIIQNVDQYSMFPIPDQMRNLKGWRTMVAKARVEEHDTSPIVLPHNAR
jgi:hypothetical protein